MKYLKTVKYSISAIALALIDCLVSANLAQAATIVNPCDVSGGQSEACSEINDNSRLPTIANNIINTALYIVGALAVCMIIFSGIRYITANGDKRRLEQSKQILIYSIVGLIVAIVAYALVNYVVELF